MTTLDIILLRVIFPIVLFAVSTVRYNGFSFVYLLFLLAYPVLPRSTAQPVYNQVFLILLITLSCIFTLSHLALHIILAVAPPYEKALEACDEISFAAQFGVQRLNGIPFYRVLRLVLPDIVILSVAVGFLVYVSRRRSPRVLTSHAFRSQTNVPIGPSLQSSDVHQSPSDQSARRPGDSRWSIKLNVAAKLPFTRDWDKDRRRMWRAWAVDTFCTLLTVLLICITGITSPSLPSSVYLLSFLSICTYWACRKDINPTPFASLRIFLLIYAGLHVCLYYLYQFPFFQLFCKDGDFIARLLGLYYIMRTSCNKPGELLFPPDVRTVDYIAPPLTIVLYYVLVLETHRWLELHHRHSGTTFTHDAHNVRVIPTAAWTADDHESFLEVAQETATPADSVNTPESIENLDSRSSPVVTKQLITPVSHLEEFEADLSTDDPLKDKHPAKPCPIYRANSNPDDHSTSSGSPLIKRDTESKIDSGMGPSTTVDSKTNYSNQPPEQLTADSTRHNSAYVTSNSPRVPRMDSSFGTGPIPHNMRNQNNSTGNQETERPLLLSLHYSAIRNSYIVSLIAMMAWSVTYRSWLSFILLLSACILWISPKSRTSCLYASPLIVLYAIALILIQYVYGLNLNADELPQHITPNGLQLSELGMKKWPNSVGPLALQVICLVSFWLTLRLFVNERHERCLAKLLAQRNRTPTTITTNPTRQTGSRVNMQPNYAVCSSYLLGATQVYSPHSDETNNRFLQDNPFGTVDNKMYKKFTELLREVCVKYWIVVCCLSMLFISTQQPVVIFRLFYMVMLIYFMFTFQVSYRFWRRQMIVFWWFNVVYSMAILLCIYTYQFQGSPEFWQRSTGLSSDVLKDIGLETFASAALFQRLLTPVLFLVVIILQVHYFHKPFLERSALNLYNRAPTRSLSQMRSPARDSRSTHSFSIDSGLSKISDGSPPLTVKPNSLPKRTSPDDDVFRKKDFMEDVNSALQTVAAKLTKLIIRLTNCCWRFLEVHWIKLVSLLIIYNAVIEVIAPHTISLVLMVMCFPFRKFHGFLATVIFLWTGLLTFGKMCYQLTFIQFNLTTSCNTTYNQSDPIDGALWIGLTKVENFTRYITPMGALMVVSVTWHAIIYRQRQFHNSPRNVQPEDGIIFGDITIKSLDDDLRNVVKFAINYGFFKFGLELCHCVTVVTACLRADAFSVLYLILMLFFLFTRREVCARLWFPYLFLLGALIPIQYASCVGWPPGLCWTYPWITNSTETDNLLQWLFLPGNYGSPTADKLTADFFQFIAVALQYQVFKIEHGPEVESYGGGSNKPVVIDMRPNTESRDFVSSKESYLDYLRHLIFYWSYWVSLAIVLATGVTWITLFCLGYMILSFIYLWMGQNVMLRNRISLIKSWNLIIGYNFCVILGKCSLQLLGCVYWGIMEKQCWLIQLIGVQCMDPLLWSRFNTPALDKECRSVSSGLHWDVICFIFILFQRKVFMTESFSHVVCDLKVQSQFASRGAYLINQKLMLTISEQVACEERSLAKIRKKLDDIQKRQKVLGRTAENITEHYVMLRSGDYYLFEGNPELDDVQPLEDNNRSDSQGHKKPRFPPPPATPHSAVTSSTGTASKTPTVYNATETVGQGRAVSVPHDMQAVTNVYRSAGMGSAWEERARLRQTPLANAAPNLDQPVLNALSNFSDPYNTQRPTDNNRSLNNNRRQILGSALPRTGTESAYNAGRAVGHRRLRSHPESIRRQTLYPTTSRVNSTEVASTIVMDSGLVGPLRSVRTSPSGLLEQAATTGRVPNRRFEMARRSTRLGFEAGSMTKRKPYQSHRRIHSASAAAVGGPTSAMQRAVQTQDAAGRTPRIHRRPQAPITQPLYQLRVPSDSMEAAGSISFDSGLRDAENMLPSKRVDARKSSLPASSHHSKFTPGTLKPHDPMLSPDSRFDPNMGSDDEDEIRPVRRPIRRSPHVNDIYDGDDDDDGQIADWDSEEADQEEEEEDDANPIHSSTSRLNPLQLLNRAMEIGPYSAARQYRRSLQPPLQRMRATETDVAPVSHPMLNEKQSSFSSTQVPDSSISERVIPPAESNAVETVAMLDNRFRMPLNQSNRYWSPRKHKKSKLSSLASVDNEEDDWSESMFDLDSSASDTPAQIAAPKNPPIVRLSSKIVNEADSIRKISRNSVQITSPQRKSDPSRRQPVSPQVATTSVVRSRDPIFDSPATRDLVAGGNLNHDMSDGSTHSHTELLPPERKRSQRPEETSDADIRSISHGGTHQHEGCWSKFKGSCWFAYAFFLSFVDIVIRFFNKLTKQYRRIRRKIEQEKRVFKRSLFQRDNPEDQSYIYMHGAMYKVYPKQPDSPTATDIVPADSVPVFPNFHLQPVSPVDNIEVIDQQHDQRQKEFRRSRSRTFLLLIALGNLAIVYSEWFCYLLLILNHMRSSTILSIPYPLMVFLWGMLSVPRPTKTFWIFLITYTEVIIVIKYIFQFRFILFNDPNEKPADSVEALWLPRLLGVDKDQNYAVFDLVQLISLFLHRGFLKNDGLWRDHTEFTQDLELVAGKSRKASYSLTEGHVEFVTSRTLSRDSAKKLYSVNVNSHNDAANIYSVPMIHRASVNSWNPFAKLRRFYHKMTDPRYNKKVDVYIYMFLCEFITFWIMIFGYISFGPSTGMGDNAFEFIKANRIPLPFISMLLVQFVFIIIDRGLFLRKQVLGKFIFQILHVLLIHGWLSFILPYITKSRFNAAFAPQLLYLIKCIYFSLSAYQIRSGYPLRILGNFLTKKYNYVNLVLFKGYLIIPFLYELRNVMDWMWTNSALSLYHWMELEDIYCKIFVLKCWRRSEIAYPTPRGENRPAGKKALVGGLLLAFFFICFWGPMTLSSFIGVTFDFNPPVLCTFSLSFGGFPPTFEFTSREGNIRYVDKTFLTDFTRCHKKDLQTVGFLNNFESKDVRYITIDGFSGNIWAITPPSYDALLKKLADPRSELLLHFHMHCRRKTKEIQTSQTSVEDIFSRKLTRIEKQQLLHVLSKTDSREAHNHTSPGPNTEGLDAVTLNAAMPRYVLLKKDRLRTAFGNLALQNTYVNVSFYMHRDPVKLQTWWALTELITEPLPDPCFEILRQSVTEGYVASSEVLSIVTFNERVSDSLFGKVFSNYGIIGMYAAYIFLANRLLRTIYSNISYVICLEELPHVDRILNLCNEIYLVRENKLLRLEEQLCAKLFFLYRSSETMIKWTRHPKEILDKFTDKPGDDPRGPPPPAVPPPSYSPDRGVLGTRSSEPLDRFGSNQYECTDDSRLPVFLTSHSSNRSGAVRRASAGAKTYAAKQDGFESIPLRPRSTRIIRPGRISSTDS